MGKAREIVVLTDSINIWRQKTNQIAKDAGSTNNLTTTVDSDLVGAINELDSDIGARPHTTLTTAAKTLTGAINNLDSDIGNLSSPLSGQRAVGTSYTEFQTRLAGAP